MDWNVYVPQTGESVHSCQTDPSRGKKFGVFFVFVSVYSNGCSVPLCENGCFIAVCNNGHIRKPDRQQFVTPATGDHTKGSKSTTTIAKLT